MDEKAVGQAMKVGQFNFRPSQRVRLVVRPDIDSKLLHEALDRVLGLAGCTQCGLNGFDLDIVRGDPIIEQARQAKGIESIALETRSM